MTPFMTSACMKLSIHVVKEAASTVEAYAVGNVLADACVANAPPHAIPIFKFEQLLQDAAKVGMLLDRDMRASCLLLQAGHNG